MPDTIDATTPPTMLAARLSEPGSISNLHVVELGDLPQDELDGTHEVAGDG